MLAPLVRSRLSDRHRSYYFDRDGIYLDSATGLDYPDQADRWIAFQRAALEFVRVALSPVDILHCHDHQAALIPAYLRKLYSGHPGLSRTRTVLTIHNMGYQGIFPPTVMAKSGFDLAEFFPGSPFEYFGQLNFLKVGIAFADLVTTVSPKYAREIEESSELSFGLNGVLNDRRDPCTWNSQRNRLRRLESAGGSSDSCALQRAIGGSTGRQDHRQTSASAANSDLRRFAIG